ncbi:uncharacterized protein LOC108040492 isoform X2 [Drosophila rhopaloa]|nr:uncharacterized protein LOC108040492 isoform X2 [Drosophila rhopaloa]
MTEDIQRLSNYNSLNRENYELPTAIIYRHKVKSNNGIKTTQPSKKGPRRPSSRSSTVCCCRRKVN